MEECRVSRLYLRETFVYGRGGTCHLVVGIRETTGVDLPHYGMACLKDFTVVDAREAVRYVDFLWAINRWAIVEVGFKQASFATCRGLNSLSIRPLDIRVNPKDR